MKQKLNCILLIDDDKDTNYFNKYLLTKLNVAEKIQVSTSGQEALDFLSNGGSFLNNSNTFPVPMLIFLDLNMPVMNGWEFIEEYHKLPAEMKGKIVLIMLTSSPNPDDVQKSKTMEDLNGFVKKPLNEEMLRAILKDYFPELV